MSTAIQTSCDNIKGLFDDADITEFKGAVAVFDHIERFRGKTSIKDFVVESNMVDGIGKVRRLSSIYTIHRVVKYLRSELVDVDGVEMTADAYIDESEYLVEMNHWDDIIRFAKKNGLHILDALEQTKDMDWADIKDANGSGKAGKNKMQELREYLEYVIGNGSSAETKAVAKKALDIVS